MEREQLLVSLRNGLPISKRLHKLERRLWWAKYPVLLSGLLVGLIFYIAIVSYFSTHDGVSFMAEMGAMTFNANIFIPFFTFSLIASAIVHVIPIVHFIPWGIAFIIGKILLSAKQMQLKNEISIAEKEFVESTQLPSRFCDKKIISVFIEYLDSFQADTLKDCVNLLKAEEKHKEMMDRLKGIEYSVEEVASEQYSHNRNS